MQKGVAVLKQRAGTTKLSAESIGGQVALCDIVVRKNRITTVTVSVLERPPRCQCRNSCRQGRLRELAGLNDRAADAPASIRRDAASPAAT